MGKKRWATLLRDNKELAYISKELVTLKDDIITIDNLDNFMLPTVNPILVISDRLLSYGLKSVVDRAIKYGLSYKTTIPKGLNVQDLVIDEKKISFDAIAIDNSTQLLNIIDSIAPNSIVAFDTETTDLDTTKAEIVGFSFCFDEKNAYYVPISHIQNTPQIDKNIAKEAINRLNKHRLVLHNYKYDYEIIRNNFNITLTLFADTMIIAWLLNPTSKVGLTPLAKKIFGYEMMEFKDVVKKLQDFSFVDIETAKLYACEDAYITYKLYLHFSTKTDWLKDIMGFEFEFIKVLIEMESHGIKVDIALLQRLKEEFDISLKELTDKIYKLSKTQFNIKSTQQLGKVLFDELKLTYPKRAKTNYSTAENVLLKLKDQHPIIDEILEYRELSKLQSTYILPLLELGNANIENKIYTSFIQTGTATGRLSSKNPNLQNIPVKKEVGRQIRQAFVADDNKLLVMIDYSQIELRLLAHFSKDKALMEAFLNNEDIHTQTAIKLFGVDMASKMRNVAKSINFGLLYGMGAKKLGETLKIPTKEAKSYIDSYFQTFPTVKEYLASIQDKAKEVGYIETLLKRRRYFDFGSANSFMMASYLRESVNSVFQGSAADLIKLSMVKLHQKYQNNDKVKMLLQIHDELIFEVDKDVATITAKDIQDIMENIYKLNVPLKTSVTISNRWSK